MHERRTVRQRSLGIDDDGKRLVLDLDELHRILGGAAAQCCDHGNGIAGISRLVDCDRLVLRRVRVLGREPRARQRAVPLVGDVLARPGTDHLCMRERGRDVDLRDARVRVRAPHDPEIDHAGDVHVVHPLRLPLEKLAVLFSLDRHADRSADFDLRRSAHPATAPIASTMF